MKKSILIPYERYQRLLKQPQTQQQPEHVHTDIVEDPQMGEGNGLTLDNILQALPIRYKHKAGAILSHIQRDPEHVLSWSQDGELIYKGTVIPGSHIVDLLKDSQYEHKGRQLNGKSEFYKGLKTIHLPTTLTRIVTDEKPETTLRPPGIPVRKTRTKWIHV